MRLTEARFCNSESNKEEELYDQSKATQLRTVIEWHGHCDGAFAGHGIRSAAGCWSERQSSQNEGSIAERRSTDETICGYLLPGRQGIFRIVGVCAKVSDCQPPFHRDWRGEWSNAGMVCSSAQN